MATTNGWNDLEHGGAVLFENGAPVRVSDQGNDEGSYSDRLAGYVADIAALGFAVKVGEWSTAAGEYDATAPLTVVQPPVTAAQINALLPVQRHGVTDNLWPSIRRGCEDDEEEKRGKWLVNDDTRAADDEVYDSEDAAVDAAISWAMACHPDLDEDEALRIYRACDRDAAIECEWECAGERGKL